MRWRGRSRHLDRFDRWDAIALDSRLTNSMAVFGLKAFPEALLGGLDSLLGALFGAAIVAGAESSRIRYVDPPPVRCRAISGLLVALVVRPWGLFGTREELDRV